METLATLVIGKNYNKIDDNMAFHFQIAKEARHDYHHLYVSEAVI